MVVGIGLFVVLALGFPVFGKRVCAIAEVSSGNPIEAIRFPDIAPYENSAPVYLQMGANPLLPTGEITIGTPVARARRHATAITVGSWSTVAVAVERSRLIGTLS